MTTINDVLRELHMNYSENLTLLTQGLRAGGSVPAFAQAIDFGKVTTILNDIKTTQTKNNDTPT
jgi:hypothetical protein